MIYKDIEVLVVGAGPVGLFCANELIRHGLSCYIIDKKEGLSDKSKALGLHIRTLDVFRDCGFLESVLAQGLAVHGALLKSHGTLLAKINFAGIGANYDYLIDLPQDKTEAILYQGLLDKNIDLEWQTELLGIEQHIDGCIASIKLPDGTGRQIKAKWIIACDGAHSTLRHLVDGQFEGAPYPEHWWLADLHINWRLPMDYMVINASEKGPLACFPMGNQRYRLVMTAPNNKKNEPTLDDIKDAFNERSSDQAILSDPIWITAFTIHHRQLQHYRYQRVFFCGDAAHIHSPMGGQGLNTGIQDVYNLIWKLALVEKENAPGYLLDTYHEERYPIGKNVLQKTHFMTKMILLKKPWQIQLRNQLIRFLTRFSVLKKAIARDLAELKIRYTTSSIVKQIGEKTHLQLGQYLPLCHLYTPDDSQKKLLSTICQGTLHHLFLCLGQQDDCDEPELTQWAMQLQTEYKALLRIHLVHCKTTISHHFSSIWVDKQGVFHKQWGLKQSTAILVRPDKYLGLVVSPIEKESILQYLRHYFQH